jgi:hypothetical protein
MAGHGRSDHFLLKTFGNGSMHMRRSFESGDLISVEIRRTWHPSTERNMPLTAERKFFTRYQM